MGCWAATGTTLTTCSTALRPDLEPLGVNGIHLFTFNQLGAAVDWQRSLAA